MLGGGYSSVSTERHGGMVHRELRRQSEPLRAQHLWDAIRAVRQQKQIPAIQRMSRYMNRFYGLSKEATQKLLDMAVEDNLVKLENKIGTKGNKSGVEEKAYRWPTLDMLPRERHDWYCFHCHAGGEVVLCGDCHRVYHEACLKEPLKPGVHTDDFLCHYCRAFQAIQGGFENGTNKRERKDLNHLLELTCKKLRAKMPANLLFRERPELKAQEAKEGEPPAAKDDTPSTPTAPTPAGGSTPAATAFDGTRGLDENDDSWRVNFLLKESVDFDEIAKKCSTNQYRIVDEFRADCQLIVHNVVIYHGGHSHFADLARQMFRDCTFDLKDIVVCRDCYRYANENPEKYWYCKPCRPFHELVYARQKGFPFWPAKVMRTLDGEFDVRFFGGYHQRALVEKSQVKPISTNIHSLQVKRTSLFNKACEELRKHQSLLEKVKQNEDFLKEPYGDPFASEDLRAELGGGESSVEESSGSESEEETAAATATAAVVTAPPQLPVKQDADPKPTSPPAKKKRGRQKKSKDEPPPASVATTTCINGTPVTPSQSVQSESENQVSSSSPNFQETPKVSVSVQTPNKLLKGLILESGNSKNQSVQEAVKAAKKEFKQYIEKMRADFDQEKKRAVNVATRSLERDLERLKADHTSEVEETSDRHREQLSQNKKKQWCYNCETEAMYWCCWNTAYCSIECQQKHWHTEHKRSCRRKQ